MHKALKLIGITFLCFSLLIGCSSATPPKEVVNTFFTALQDSNFDQAMAQTAENDGSAFEFEDEEQENMIKALMSSLEFEVIDSTIDGKTATVETKVTTVDAGTVMSNLISETMESSLNGEFDEVSQEEMQKQMLQKFSDTLSSPDAPKTEKTINIQLEKKDNAWVIITDDELSKAITGGMAQ